MSIRDFKNIKNSNLSKLLTGTVGYITIATVTLSMSLTELQSNNFHNTSTIKLRFSRP